jgi:hypothetical protein
LRAINQLGGIGKAAEAIDRGVGYLYDALNPDRDVIKKNELKYRDARVMSRAGATALAEDLALQAGGLFLPPVPDTAPAAIHAALARYASESGEAMSVIISRAADGVFDVADARAALKEIDEALRAMMTLRSLAVTVLDSGEAVR